MGWLHQKLADLDLQCFQKPINLGSAELRLIARVIGYHFDPVTAVNIHVCKCMLKCLSFFENNKNKNNSVTHCFLLMSFVDNLCKTFFCDRMLVISGSNRDQAGPEF